MSTRSFRWLRPVPRLLLTPIGLLLLVSGVGLCLALVLGSQDVLIIFGLLLSAAIVVLGLAQVFAMPPNLPFLPRTIGTARLVWLLRFLLGTIVVVASGYIGAWSSGGATVSQPSPLASYTVDGITSSTCTALDVNSNPPLALTGSGPFTTVPVTPNLQFTGCQ